MSARTARRRRSQAVGGYRHLARIGKGNNNRPIYHKRDVSTLTKREQELRQRMRDMAARKSFKKK